MAFPVSPNDGDKANVNGVTYTYSSSLSAWTVTSNFLETFTGNALIANTATIAGELSTSTMVSGNILPSANATYALGSATSVWQDIYLSNSTIFLGEATISASGANLVLPATVQIGDATLSSDGGNLALPENITATTITAGNIIPSESATHDLGTSSLRWRTVYTSDLDLNNGIGDWTIVEGEDDLFLYNNRKGKVYKFALIEVDPDQATPKIDGLK